MARFLVVDDDHSTTLGMTRLLTAEGHDVTPCTAGAAAVEVLASQSFDAVVTDLEMPHVSGHAVVQAARECSPTACLVVVTARAAEAAQALTEAGACIVADKPMDYAGITKAIADCRARGGPGPHGRCHKRSPPGELVRLRRR